MRNKLTAFLLAALLLFSGVVLAACRDEAEQNAPPEKSTAESSEYPASEPFGAPADILFDALAKTHDFEFPVFNKGSTALKGNTRIETDSFYAQSEANITSEMAEAGRFSGNVGYKIGGDGFVTEQLTAETCGDRDYEYLTVTELSALPIKHRLKTADSEEFTFLSVNGLLTSMKAYLDSVKQLLTDEQFAELFTAETRDITIGSTEFKGENVITFKADRAQFAEILAAHASLAEENPEIERFSYLLTQAFAFYLSQAFLVYAEEVPLITDYSYSVDFKAVISQQQISATELSLDFKANSESGPHGSLSFTKTEKASTGLLNLFVTDYYSGFEDAEAELRIPFSIQQNGKGFRLDINKFERKQGIIIEYPINIFIDFEFKRDSVTLSTSMDFSESVGGVKRTAYYNVSPCESPEYTAPQNYIHEKALTDAQKIKFDERYPMINSMVFKYYPDTDDPDIDDPVTDPPNPGFSAEQIVEVGDVSGAYIFYPNGTGFYSTSFEAAAHESNRLDIELQDGRRFTLDYGEISYDSQGVGYTKINGLQFSVTETVDDSETRTQTLKCTENIQGFEKAPFTINIIYYPELEYGAMTVGFLYEASGNDVILNYADGNTGRKTLLKNEETGEYYFDTQQEL